MAKSEEFVEFSTEVIEENIVDIPHQKHKNSKCAGVSVF
jgi:hypothetical protein